MWHFSLVLGERWCVHNNIFKIVSEHIARIAWMGQNRYNIHCIFWATELKFSGEILSDLICAISANVFPLSNRGANCNQVESQWVMTEEGLCPWRHFNKHFQNIQMISNGKIRPLSAVLSTRSIPHSSEFFVKSNFNGKSKQSLQVVRKLQQLCSWWGVKYTIQTPPRWLNWDEYKCPTASTWKVRRRLSSVLLILIEQNNQLLDKPSLRSNMHALSSFLGDFWPSVLSSTESCKLLYTRHKLTRVQPGLKLTQVSFYRVNNAKPGSTRISLSCKHC